MIDATSSSPSPKNKLSFDELPVRHRDMYSSHQSSEEDKNGANRNAEFDTQKYTEKNTPCHCSHKTKHKTNPIRSELRET